MQNTGGRGRKRGGAAVQAREDPQRPGLLADRRVFHLLFNARAAEQTANDVFLSVYCVRDRVSRKLFTVTSLPLYTQDNVAIAHLLQRMINIIKKKKKGKLHSQTLGTSSRRYKKKAQFYLLIYHTLREIAMLIFSQTSYSDAIVKVLKNSFCPVALLLLFYGGNVSPVLLLCLLLT